MIQHWPRGQQLVLAATAATLASSSVMHSGKLRPGGAPPVWSSTDPHPPVSGAAHVAPGHVTWLLCSVCMVSKLLLYVLYFELVIKFHSMMLIQDC